MELSVTQSPSFKKLAIGGKIPRMSKRSTLKALKDNPRAFSYFKEVKACITYSFLQKEQAIQDDPVQMATLPCKPAHNVDQHLHHGGCLHNDN